MQLTTRLHLRPKTKSELAAEYQLNRATIRRRCAELGIGLSGKLLSILEVAKYYETQGAPGIYEQQTTLNFEA